MKQLNYDLKVVLICDQGLWVAQCLEHDIAAQGKSIKAAMRTFSKLFAGQVFLDIENGKEPLEDFTPAPVEYWEMLEEASPLKTPTPIKMPPTLAPGGVGFAYPAVFA